MKIETMDRLAMLPEEEAVQRFFDGINYRVLRWLLFAAALAGFVMLVEFHHDRRPPGIYPLQSPLAFVHCFLVIAMFFSRKKQFFERHFRNVFLTWVIVQFLLAASIFYMFPTIVIISLVVFPPMLLFFRLRTREYFLLAAIFATTNLIAGLAQRSDLQQVLLKNVLLPVFVNGAYVSLALALAGAERRRFVTEWRTLSSREHERMRMIEELEVARQIQLSMLPDTSPQLPWIDLSSISTPATEVGGDFFDFFVLDAKRLAIVVGDVAGHGLPSGIVLSAVKSGLFLLRHQLDDPARAMLALNEMVRDSIRWRMLVSMIIAIVDRDRGTMRVICAGHPPLLHRSAATGEIREIGRGSLPIGSRLPVKYSFDEHPIAGGDSLLFVTDGATELSRNGEVFGEERLAQLLREPGESAASLVDRLVHELSAFRAGEPQADDITIVAARIRD